MGDSRVDALPRHAGPGYPRRNVQQRDRDRRVRSSPGYAGIKSGTKRAFRWTPLGGMRDLGILPGGSYSSGEAINALGQVTGYADAKDGHQHAFRWTRATACGTWARSAKPRAGETESMRWARSRACSPQRVAGHVRSGGPHAAACRIWAPLADRPPSLSQSTRQGKSPGVCLHEQQRLAGFPVDSRRRSEESGHAWWNEQLRKGGQRPGAGHRGRGHKEWEPSRVPVHRAEHPPVTATGSEEARVSI